MARLILAPARPPRGVAALLVVMTLFFIAALVAAYTNRNLIIEQRISSASARTEQALQQADAAVDWAITMLNAGRINENCEPTQDTSFSDFRRRYLILDADSGGYDYYTRTSGRFYAGCLVQGAAMYCVCPTSNSSTVTPAGGDANSGAFRINYTVPAGQGKTPPGSVILQVRGCSDAGSGSTSCLSSSSSTDADSVADVRANLGLVSALPNPPAATLTAGRNIDATGVQINAANSDGSTGLAVHAGGTISGATSLSGAAGSSSAGSSRQLASDSALAALQDSGNLFPNVFGLDGAHYKRQPAAVRVTCSGGTCRMSDLEAANWLTGFPGKPVWVDGNLEMDASPSAAAGTSVDPLLLVVNGTLTISANVAMVGFIYANDITWAASGASVRGAMLAARDFTATSNATLTYDAALLNTIKTTYGSFVRVPGGWNRGGI